MPQQLSQDAPMSHLWRMVELEDTKRGRIAEFVEGVGMDAGLQVLVFNAECTALSCRTKNEA